MFRKKNKRCDTVVTDYVLEIYTWYFEGCLFYPLYLINFAFFASINFQQKIRCVFVDVSELVVLLSRHKIDDKEDITL